MAEKTTSFVVELEVENDNAAEAKKKTKIGKNFINVLRSKYCNTNDDFRFGYFGGKPPKKRTNSEGDAELGYLTNVCVSNSKIKTSGLQEQSIKSLCPNVVDLDISGNLLDSWSEILLLVQQLQNLKFLNLARNSITKDSEALYECTDPLPNIENLVLNKTNVKWKDALQLAKLLPKLKELHICGNSYKTVPAGKHHGLHSVECLRMNDNHITSWDEVWKLRHLPNLKSLILSGNPLADVFYYGNDLDPDCKCSCHDTVTANDNTSDNSGKLVADNDKATVADNEAVDNNRANGEIQITRDDDDDNQDKLGDGVSSIVDTTDAIGNNLVETLQEEVRQYCENILNAVIDDVIRNEIIEADDASAEIIKADDAQGKENRVSQSEKIDQSIDKNEDITNNIDDTEAKKLKSADGENVVYQQGENNQNTTEVEKLQDQTDLDKQFEEVSESRSVINGKTDQDDIEQLSREIVELIIRKALDFVSEEVKGGSELQKNTTPADPTNKNTEKEENDEMKNEGKISGEELIKRDNSCCLCKEESISQQPFTSLETLCVSETKIGKWKHLSALRTFPALKSVRIKNVKLASKLDDEDRRKLFMASLPNIKQLNGSEVSHSEREKSERFLLRHFYEKKLKPDIYHTLEKRHGELPPLVDIDISKGLSEYVNVRFIYQGNLAFSENICVRNQAYTMRNLIAKNISPSVKHAILYHKLCNSKHAENLGELQELRGGSLPLSRLEIFDGDEIIIDESRSLRNWNLEYYFPDTMPDIQQNTK